MNETRSYMKRKPYNKRYYLLYGNDETPPESIDPDGTLEFLEGLGYGENSLKQARNGRNLSLEIGKKARALIGNGHSCDFCGTPLSGTEYEVLKDGRERCTMCSRSAIKTEKEFIALFEEVCANLRKFFGIEIKNGIRVQMVNARTLHKSLGLSFIPTAKADGRVLGVAIRKRKEFILYIENGSPRMEATKTMVHELTHIWQYQNWDPSEIYRKYGKNQNIEIYEGMAKWVEVQYCFLLGEAATGNNAEYDTLHREDEYGRGFVKYCSVYPLSYGCELEGDTPFDDPHQPL